MATAAELSSAKEKAPSAARDLFASDSRIFSVGIGRRDSRYVWRAVRNVARPRGCGSGRCLEVVAGLPVYYRDVRREPTFHVNVACSPTPRIPAPSQPRRVLRCGAQVQNYDCDVRQGQHQGFMHKTLGTLGCFVRLSECDGGELALLSNAHVLCPRGDARSADAIYSDGCTLRTPANDVAWYRAVHHCGLPVTSHKADAPEDGSSDWNEADAALAILRDHIDHKQELSTPRGSRPLNGYAEAMPGDCVYKFGQQTRYTEGMVDAVAEIIRVPAPTPNSWYWFRNAFSVIARTSSQNFTDFGDSGSVIVRENDDMAVGLNFAGGSGLSFANDMATVLKHLNCRLA